MTDIFSPPSNPQDGDGYTFGNIVWEYEANNGVWNIRNASLVGAQGAQGLQGLQGQQGTQGVQGIQGVQGVQGPAGSGAQGTQGIQGVQGTQGVQGVQGTQGVQGVQGTQGVQGVQGTQGVQGRQGTQGIQGVQGTQGVQGVQGTQGVQGPIGTGLNAGSVHQILFKDGSNAVAGDADFLFDGAGATFGGLSFAFDSDVHVMKGIYRLPSEWSNYLTPASSASLSITPTNGTVQRIVFTPSAAFTVNFDNAGWNSTTNSVETVAVILACQNGITGEFNNNIYTETGSRKPVIGGVTGGIDILTMIRVNTGGGNALRMAFQVANGMTGTGKDNIN